MAVAAGWPPPPELPVPEAPLDGALAVGMLPEPFSVVPEPAPVALTDVEYGGTQTLCEGGATPASKSQGRTTADPSTMRAGGIPGLKYESSRLRETADVHRLESRCLDN